MSLYNAICGITPGHDLLLAILGQTPETVARYRDCFVNKELEIEVYTRIGGNNREDYETDIQAMRAHPLFVRDYDDDFDSTFAYFVFKFPNDYPKELRQQIYDKTTAVVGTPRERFDIMMAKMRNPEKFKDDPQLQNAMEVGKHILDPIIKPVESNEANDNLTIVEINKDGSVQTRKK